MRYAFPYDLTPEPEGGFSLAFPDVPGARSQGETEAECAIMAEDALVTALSAIIEGDMPPPVPSPVGGRPVAIVPPLAAAKLALYEAKMRAGISNVELARRLGANEKAVRRLLDPLYRSHIGSVDAAVRALGCRLVIDAVQDAA
jgi:antitoxin HicB